MGLTEYAAAISTILSVGIPHFGELATLDKQTLQVQTSFRPSDPARTIFFVQFWKYPSNGSSSPLFPEQSSRFCSTSITKLVASSALLTATGPRNLTASPGISSCLEPQQQSTASSTSHQQMASYRKHPCARNLSCT